MSNSKINVVYIAAHLGGGAGKAISGLIKGLTNYDSTLLLLEKPVETKYYDACIDAGINVTVSNDIQVIRHLAEDNDLIILNWWCHPLFVKVFQALDGIDKKIIIWSHINGLHYPYMPFEFIGMFDGCMFTSSCTFDNDYWSDKEKEKIRQKSAIVYGIGDFKPEKCTHKTGHKIHGSFRIGYTGTLSFNKASREFPIICEEIKNIIPDASFEMYGRTDDDFEKSFDSDYVHFNGYTDDLNDILPQMDIFCYPLNAVNFATTENALLEAMAAGLPVVVLDNPTMRSIITHGKNGLIAMNTDQFVRYVKELYLHDDLRKMLGENARKSVIDRYDGENNCEVCEKYIERVMRTASHQHDFAAKGLTTSRGFFKYFCYKDYEQVEKYLNGDRSITLPDIYLGKGKSSFSQFNTYFHIFEGVK